MRFTLFVFSAVLLSAGLAAETSAPTPAAKLSELDQERVKRINLQINALRMQYEMNAGPVLQEQQALVERVCSAAKIPVADCVINADSGTVTKREPEKAAAPTKP